jgi:hypothetical protein
MHAINATSSNVIAPNPRRPTVGGMVVLYTVFAKKYKTRLRPPWQPHVQTRVLVHEAARSTEESGRRVM